jgi:hypothetical protein
MGFVKRLLGIFFIGIEIVLGIERLSSVYGRILLDAKATASPSTEHCSNSIQFDFSFPAFLGVQSPIQHQDTLYRRAFQGRAACNPEITPSSRPAVALGNIQRNGLAGTQPLVPCGPTDSIQADWLLVYPGSVTCRMAINAQFFISEGHCCSIPTAIPMSIWTAVSFQPPSFFLNISLTTCGFAFPLVSFITWPTKKPRTFFWPPR